MPGQPGGEPTEIGLLPAGELDAHQFPGAASRGVAPYHPSAEGEGVPPGHITVALPVEGENQLFAQLAVVGGPEAETAPAEVENGAGEGGAHGSAEKRARVAPYPHPATLKRHPRRAATVLRAPSFFHSNQFPHFAPLTSRPLMINKDEFREVRKK